MLATAVHVSAIFERKVPLDSLSFLCNDFKRYASPSDGPAAAGATSHSDDRITAKDADLSLAKLACHTFCDGLSIGQVRECGTTVHEWMTDITFGQLPDNYSGQLM